jgi:transposase-like protein
MVRIRRYPVWFRQRVLETPGTLKQVARHWKVSDRTVRRWRDLYKQKGSLEPGRFSPGRPLKLSAFQLFLLGFFKLLFPGNGFLSLSLKDNF